MVQCLDFVGELIQHPLQQCQVFAVILTSQIACANPLLPQSLSSAQQVMQFHTPKTPLFTKHQICLPSEADDDQKSSAHYDRCLIKVMVINWASFSEPFRPHIWRGRKWGCNHLKTTSNKVMLFPFTFAFQNPCTSFIGRKWYLSIIRNWKLVL